MEHELELKSGERIVIHSKGLTLSFSLDDKENICSQLSSNQNSGRILVRQHKGDHKTLVISSEKN